MKLNPDILLYAYPNYDSEATGYRKVFLTPQVNYTRGIFTAYALMDVPLYQYIVKTQVGSAFQATAGISYRFSIKSRTEGIPAGSYYCPMHPKVFHLLEIPVLNVGWIWN